MNGKQEVVEEVVVEEPKKENKFILSPSYNLPENPSMADLFVFCLANEGGIEVSLSTYQRIPETLRPLFKQK